MNGYTQGVPAGYEDDNDFDDDLVYGEPAPKKIVSIGQFLPKANIDPNNLIDWGAIVSANPEPEQTTEVEVIMGVTSKDGKKDTLFLDNLRLAASNGNLEMVKSIIKDQGIPVDIPLKNGWSALMYACNHCRVEVVSFLLESGADPNYSKKTFTPMLAAVCASPHDCHDEEVIQRRIIDCLNLLLEKGAVMATPDQFKATALHFAVKKNRILVIPEIIKLGAKVNQADSYGYTPLHYAARFGYGRAARLLVDSGANLNALEDSGHRPEDIAHFHGHEEVAKLLAKLRKDPKNTEDLVVDEDVQETGLFANSSGECDYMTRQLRGDLRVFLQGLNLSYLEDVFVKNDMATLPQVLTMTEEDLKKMGIESLGHRKTIMAGIEGFNLNPGFSKQSLPFLNTVEDTAAARKFREKYKTEKTGSEITSLEVYRYLFNVSRHLLYMQSNLKFIERKMSTSAKMFEDSKDDIPYKSIAKEFNDCVRNSSGVLSVLKDLSKDLKEADHKYDLKPTDLILPQAIDPFIEEGVFLSCFDSTSVNKKSSVTRNLTISAVIVIGAVVALFLHRSSV